MAKNNFSIAYTLMYLKGSELRSSPVLPNSISERNTAAGGPEFR